MQQKEVPVQWKHCQIILYCVDIQWSNLEPEIRMLLSKQTKKLSPLYCTQSSHFCSINSRIQATWQNIVQEGLIAKKGGGARRSPLATKKPTALEEKHVMCCMLDSDRRQAAELERIKGRQRCKRPILGM